MKKKYLMLTLVLSGFPFVSHLWAQDTLRINFTGMTPHIGQDLFLYLRDPVSGVFADSMKVSPVDAADFTVKFDSIVAGNSYYLDFFADLNANGMYDVPPTDHAWRITLDSVRGDSTITFIHNTDFTDIFPDTASMDSWYKLTVDFSSMDPHIGQELILYLRNPETGDFIDSVRLDPVAAADFSVVFDSVAVDVDYNLDFYADLNGNGMYDIPPADHAWRIQLTQILNDTTIAFVHNTTFTDIGLAITGIDDLNGEAGFVTYPNPVKSELSIQISKPGTGLSIYDVTGTLLMHKSLTSADKQVKLDVSSLKPGIYILRLDRDSGTSQRKFLKD